MNLQALQLLQDELFAAGDFDGCGIIQDQIDALLAPRE